MKFRAVFDALDLYLKDNFGLNLIEPAYDDNICDPIAIGIVYKVHKCVAFKTNWNVVQEYSSIDQFFQSQKEKKITKRDPLIVPAKVFSNQEKQEFLLELLPKVGIKLSFRKYYLKNTCSHCV